MTVFNMLTYRVRIGCTRTPKIVLANNLETANKSPGIMTNRFHKDIVLGRVSPHDGSFPFFCSPLGLVSKSDGGWRRIHHLSYSHGDSVNDWIPESYGQHGLHKHGKHLYTGPPGRQMCTSPKKKSFPAGWLTRRHITNHSGRWDSPLPMPPSLLSILFTRSAISLTYINNDCGGYAMDKKLLSSPNLHSLLYTFLANHPSAQC